VPKGLFHAIPNSQKHEPFHSFVTFHKHEEVNKILYLLALSNEATILRGQQISCQNPTILFSRNPIVGVFELLFFLMLEMDSTPS